MRPARYLVAAVCVLAPAGCGGGGEIDSGETEAEIAAGVEEATATKDVEIDCPDDVKQEKDVVFECDLSAAGGVKAKVKVTQLDDDGKIHWEVNP